MAHKRAKRRRFWRNPQQAQWEPGSHLVRRKCPRCTYTRAFLSSSPESYLELIPSEKVLATKNYLTFRPWRKEDGIWRPTDHQFHLPVQIWVSDTNYAPTSRMSISEFYPNPELERYHWHQGPPD